MDLKAYLKKTLEDDVASKNKAIEDDDKSLEILSQTEINEADYQVEIKSGFGCEFGGDVKVRYKGSLNKAIKMAQDQFKNLNHKSSVNGTYFVKVILGNSSIEVPKDYWSEFTKEEDKISSEIYQLTRDMPTN